MCGIVGAVVFNDNFKITPSYIDKMRDVMFHRGPDGAGTWVSGDSKIGLGHRRLSIVDLSETAAQPMATEDESIVISFNGEIYNHASIRKELNELRKIEWRTDHSDTEVILRAYEQWGIDCLERFRGMFGIAIWDKKEKNLWLIRDRMGIKPVYYSAHNGRLTFASEIKALLEDPDQKREVNNESLYHYLSFLTTPAPNTLFKGIKKLSPGTLLKIELDGTIEERKYYELWDNINPINTSDENEISKRVLDSLSEAVDLRKMGDVPVGVFLSGGIDSSTNAALFSNKGKLPLKTFSIGYEGDYETYTNELEHAKFMADEVNADYYDQKLTQKDLLDFLPSMVKLQDEPIADPVCVPVYYVSKLAKDNGVTVCQVGEGADELFMGYPTWKLKHSLQKAGDLPLTSIFKKLGVSILKALGKNNSHQFEALRRSSLGQPVFWGGAEAFTETQKRKLLSKEVLDSVGGITSWDAIKPYWDKFHDKAWEKSKLNWMTYLDLNLRLPELLLMRVDKMSMGVSLEGRVPFLDHKFVELALSIPEEVKVKNGELKRVLKKAVRGLIPDQIIDRKKQGFGVPVYEWIYDELGQQIKRDMEEFCEETNFFNKEEIDKLLSVNSGAQTWYLYNFVQWWKEYIKQ